VSDNLLILASASPRRREVLAELGVRFEVRPCTLPEPQDKPASITPAAWAEALAHFKTRSVAEDFPGRWVLGADTIVVCGGELLGKPDDVADARRMLELQAGRATDVITGVCVLRCGPQGQHILNHETTTVWMRHAADEREAYLRSGDWRGKAGAYGIQTVGDRLVERIDGSFSNVVGLPRSLVLRMLRQAGVLPEGEGHG
jgi:septum formation protein